ncbi:MAG: N-methyl-L-tryptophan oxidase, partial [Rhodothermaceae bacterium]|nr:N-methyl-L-tryptophan oxidase [Rhodothermaceae bacterium]
MAMSFDVIMVGVGAMGAATCHALAERGLRVLGLEQFGIPTALGSSGGDTRLCRMAYYEHPAYVPLLRRAYAHWDALHDRTGEQVFHRTGLVSFGLPEGELLRGTRASAEHYGVTVEEVARSEACERFPAFEVPEAYEAVFEPDAGFLLATRAIHLYAQQAKQHGAVLRARERVQSWVLDGDGVRVVTERGTYLGSRVVFTSGAWTSGLLPTLRASLRVTRQVYGWVQPLEPERFAVGRFPGWLLESEAHGIYYGFPMLPAEPFGCRPGLKLGRHVAGGRIALERLDRAVSTDEEEDFRRGLRRFLPSAHGPTLDTGVCLYTMTPDEHFVVGPVPSMPQVFVASGFSGHGFKFAPVIGEVLADLVTEGVT